MKLTLCFIIITIIGCEPYPTDGLEKEAIYYGTDAFYDFMHQVDNISLDDAWDKQMSYIKNNRETIPMFGWYFFAIVENYYIPIAIENWGFRRFEIHRSEEKQALSYAHQFY